MAIKKKDSIPLAINILKIQRYNYNHFGCEEVVLFEYLLVKAVSFKFKPFFHSSETIFNETGIKKHSLATILKRFELLGYISIEVKGMPRVKHFIVHFPKVYEDIALIYKLDENGHPLYEFRKLLADYFHPLIENYQEQYNKKNTNNNNEKENNDYFQIGDVSVLKIFNEMLFNLKNELVLTPSQYAYSDVDALNLLNNYELETIEKYLKKYFNEGTQKKLSGFLKFDDLAKNKNVYIENQKNDEQIYFDKFIQSLQDLYDDRLDIYNKNSKNKRGKKLTKLIFNNNIKEKIKEAVAVHGELGFNHAFIAYTDAVLSGSETPNKFLPFFLAKNFGVFGVIETYLDYYNINYGYDKN